MKRLKITRSKFYDIRRFIKRGWDTRKDLCDIFEISPTTLSRIEHAKNFKEYKASGSIYGKGVKVLRKRYLFILGVIAVVLIILNLR